VSGEASCSLGQAGCGAVRCIAEIVVIDSAGSSNTTWGGVSVETSTFGKLGLMRFLI